MIDTKINDEVGLGGAVGALLEGAGAGGDAEAWAARLSERAARDDALNVAGMLAAAGGGGGARLADQLQAGGEAGSSLRSRLTRYEQLLRGAPDAVLARSGAARLEANQRHLLSELRELVSRLDVTLTETEPDLGTSAGRARAIKAAEQLRAALRDGGLEGGAGGGGAVPQRLAAVRERLRRLSRARDRLATCLGRHLNNLLIHRGNEASAGGGLVGGVGGGVGAGAGAGGTHHAELLQYAPFMRWLREMDDKTYEALMKVYVSTWSRVYERELHAAVESARAQLDPASPYPPSSPAVAAAALDQPLDNVLSLVESLCNSEQEFCTQFFCLDVDVKGEGSDGSRSERSEEGVGGGGARRGGAGPEARRLLADLFPTLEGELVALVQHMEKTDTYGAMRALACVGRRVLSGEGGSAGTGTTSAASTALAAAAVAAKRGADRAIQERTAAYHDAVKQAAKRPRCGLFSFLQEFEEISAALESMFSADGRRSDVERWYCVLAAAQLTTIAGATHPRTPRALLQLENYHRLHALLAALRLPALDVLKREAKSRYTEALRSYVTSSLGQPLEKLQRFFSGVAEAVAGGTRDEEVGYLQLYSKHELRKLLALYPPHEVRKSLHRQYKTVEKQLSSGGALLQVVWRAMLEHFLDQHRAIQSRIAACYPGAGLTLPLSTQDILEAFSDIAQQH